MKKQYRKNKALIFITTGIVLVTSIFASQTILKKEREDVTPYLRTVELDNIDLNLSDLEDEFEQIDVESNKEDFKVKATKEFDADVFNEIDLIGLENEEKISVRYELEYIKEEETIYLTAIREGKDEVLLIETIPGLVTYNSKQEADILFSIDGECIWMSQLKESIAIDEIGWFSDLFKSVVNAVAGCIAKLLAPAIRLATNISVKLLGAYAGEIGAFFLNMSKDSNNDFHADFDCWQQYFGYTDLYDTIFDGATKMRKGKFPFDITGDGIYDHIIWAWKGDYLNLGAGAELGIYKRWKYSDDIWQVIKV